MIYSICQLNKLMQQGTEHPLLTVLDTESPSFAEFVNGRVASPPLGGSGEAFGFHVIIFRKNTSREDERFGRSPKDFRAATISFYPAGRKLDLTDCLGIIAFDNEYFDSIADEFPYFNFYENESLHISDRDLKKWQDIAFMLKKELQESIDDSTRLLLKDGLHTLLDLAHRFYKHQIVLREKRYSIVAANVESMIADNFYSHKRQPSISVMAKRMGMSKAYLDEVMKVMTGKDTATYCKVWKNNHQPTLSTFNFAI